MRKLEAFRAAGELLKDRNNRCRGSLFQNQYGVATDSIFACKFCLEGAMYKVTESDPAEFAIGIALTILFDVKVPFQMWDEASDEEQDEIVNRLLTC